MASGRCPSCGQIVAGKPGDSIGEHQEGGSGTPRCPGSGGTAQ